MNKTHFALILDFSMNWKDAAGTDLAPEQRAVLRRVEMEWEKLMRSFRMLD